MADWTDGPEYAPVARPDGFATPRTVPLAIVEPEPSPADDQPSALPAGYAEPDGVRELDTLVPRVSPPRDPSEPFDASGGIETGWAAAHSWKPTMPLGDAAAPSPRQAAVLPPGRSFPPPQGAPVAVPTVDAPSTGSQAMPPAAPALPLDRYPAPTGPAVPLPPPGAAPAPQAPTQLAPGQQRQQWPAPGQAGQQPQPGGWNAGPTPPPPIPGQPAQGQQPPRGAIQALGGVGLVMLGVLVFGMFGFIPYLMLLIGSFLVARLPMPRIWINRAYSLSFVLLLASLVLDWAAGDPTAHLRLVGQWCCALVGVVTVWSAWREGSGNAR